MTLEKAELTNEIIAAAIRVHRTLGPGFLESIYERALVVELGRRKLKTRQQQEITIQYAGVEVGKHILDLFVADTIVVELKAVKEFKDIHFSIVRSYLKAINRKHGLLLNFHKPTLEIKRVINS